MKATMMIMRSAKYFFEVILDMCAEPWKESDVFLNSQKMFPKLQHTFYVCGSCLAVC